MGSPLDGGFVADLARRQVGQKPTDVPHPRFRVVSQFEEVREVSFLSIEPPPKPEPKVVQLHIEAAPSQHVELKLQQVEKAAADLSLSMQAHGGIVGAGKDVERRIMIVVNKLWSLVDYPPVKRAG